MFFYFIALILSSIAGFLFPLFASYKAIKSSDPAQLTPWLMYWVVFGCLLLVEWWTEWILWWVPFYYYIRLLFLLYLVSPQTQGARFLYETYVHPFIRENETQIDELIARTHERLRKAGMRYLKQAIEMVKTRVLGMPPGDPSVFEAEPPAPQQPQTPTSYISALLARFSVPAAAWTASQTSNAGGDFYSLLAGAVSALASTAATHHGNASLSAAGNDSPDASRSSSLIPADVRGTADKMSFIAAQQARLNILLGALDREARELQREDAARPLRNLSTTFDAENEPGPWGSPLQRPASGLSGFSGASVLSKSRSEADFEKIDVDSSGPEDEGLRRRQGQGHGSRAASGGSSTGGWIPWGWGGSGAGSSPGEEDKRD